MPAALATPALPGKYVRVGSSGSRRGIRCTVCGSFVAAGWGFLLDGQITTTRAHVCDGCAEKIAS
jgi:hypothetical protein